MIDESAIRQPVTDGSRADYEAPHFERHALRLVTLGGTPDGADSGAPGTEGLPTDPIDSDEETGEWRDGYF